jgi:5'-3' exonuclease
VIPILLLIDANNLFMRSWHATRHDAMTAGEESTAALVVFTNTLLRHIREEKPDKVVVCWDGGGSAYRLRLLPSYKGTRVKSASVRTSKERALAKQFLSLAGVFHIERPGVEADDLIAKYWHDADEKIVVVSEDKDFLQLASWNPQGRDCEVLRSTGERWNRFTVQEKTGSSPENLPSVMALTGDTSDNVIGVPSIGPVKAVQLLSEAGWDLEAIEHPGVRQMLPQVRLNRLLVNLRLPLPGLELASPPMFDPTTRSSALFDELLRFLEEYQMKGLLGRALSGTLWNAESEIA